ncbi:MAG TPA: hypothetical protein VM009_02935 [Terriglobales bacterium]|nr:hypothetical protein [Terriglobales bacterium]
MLRKVLKIVVPVLLLAALVMIVAPRIWVKNKKARLIYAGHATDSFLLYHGSGGRLLIAPKIAGEAPFQMYDPQRGTAACGPGAFVTIKVAAIETRTDSRCTWFGTAKDAKAGPNALRFTSSQGKPIEVMWQDAPR